MRRFLFLFLTLLFAVSLQCELLAAQSAPGTYITITDDIFHAVKSNDVTSLALIVDQDADVNQQDFEGFTPLMYAAQNGNQRVFRLLMSCNAKPNIRNIHGETALMIASRYGNTEIVEKLLSAGANAALSNEQGKTALEIAKLYGHENIVRCIQKGMVARS